MGERVRPYLFYDSAVSICSTCYARVEAKILIQEERVYLDKRCPRHGHERVLISVDAEYYRRSREDYLKPADLPRRFATPERWGCPYDCGLCPSHEQHSCLTLIEIGDGCNLECPICYAESGPSRTTWRSLEEIERMLDALVAAEGEPDVVQISGGEPTLHPEFFAVLDAARRRPIRHLMLNTNGVRIAADRAFAERLASYAPGFEVYLQFDSLEREPLVALRGVDLREVRRRALEVLDELDLSTTLVVTLMKGKNDGEVGRLIEHALEHRAVRGVTFQPIQAAGRLVGHEAHRDRLTLSEVRRAILEQSDVFRPADVVPVPCHPDALAMAYALKTPGGVVPLTGLVDREVLLAGTRNTITFEREPAVLGAFLELFGADHSPESSAASLKKLLCCLPRVELPGAIGYADVFRVIVMQFSDAHDFDLRSIKRTCVHIAHSDGRLIPFDTYNLFYRDGLEAERLAPLRARAEQAFL